MERISPTRMNLLSRKAQHKLAREGVGMLKQKREVLLSRFMELVKPLMQKQRQLHGDMVRAFHCLNTARAVDGKGALESAALLREQQVKIEITKDINWGVEIPKITSVEGIGEEFREQHWHANSLRIYETRDRFEKILELLFELAPLEASLKRLGKEIQKTSRRINALEVMLMPRLQTEIRFIRDTLEEREREDSFRLRRIKNKKEQ